MQRMIPKSRGDFFPWFYLYFEIWTLCAVAITKLEKLLLLAKSSSVDRAGETS